ncbi:MAG: LacI family transcriptional regulator [Acidimicrobiaceae bacterium]|nr:LacI family transcriptional regulator [Acidimicrobiaceae bacterium]MYF43442.1 LacI family transcriptional regulator [Acidimicrobiaceae bacterium]
MPIGHRLLFTAMATIRDVATEAGLSTATVSRVMNNNGSVDVALVARVNEAIDRLGYRANPLGRALRRKRTPIWGFLASDIEAPFFASLLHGLEGQALINGKLLMLCNTGEDLERERQYIQTALDYQFGGLVIAAASMTATELDVLQDEMPVVLVDRVSAAYPDIDAVLVNNHLGAYSAVTHLLENGYRRIGLVAGPSDISTAHERRAGYCSALVDYGIGVTDDLVATGDFFAPSGYAAATALVTADQPADALFVANGQMAVGAYAAVRDLGLSIPDELGFATFDDDLWMTLVEPSITVVRQPAYELGEAAAHILLRREDVKDPEPGEVARHILEPELVVRASSCRGVGP